MSGKYISLLVHFTWSTAHREPWIKPEWREPLFADIGGIMRSKNARLLAAGGVSDYVRNQEEQHRKHSFQEEFLKLLEKHKIDYDERYLWD